MPSSLKGRDKTSEILGILVCILKVLMARKQKNIVEYSHT
jgi:hypothetical protein